ncbi:multidrug transporter MatE [Enterovibrio norvegicus]|uniref:MATE family efflux transporter n=1 Tax=Enterovibrio norvegicus TaxID=188144 RepID=UPI0002DF8017|nr:MATE family efflux transporter [Enterovibrio norvegicus]OEE43540.1 multidrug transporter MatE [Enterovibrio norvegicus]
MATKNRITDAPIIPTFFYFALPSLAGLLAISSASIVDGIFVGRYLGAAPLASINLLIPYFTFMFSVCLMIAIGGTVLAGRYIGEKKQKKADAIFSQSLISAMLFTAVMAAIVTPNSGYLFDALNAPQDIHETMNSYFGIMSFCLIIQLTTMVLYYFVRADGFPVLATAALIFGSITNIALDILFLGYLGLGIEWAAWATTIAQSIQLIVLLSFFVQKNRTLKFTLKGLKIKESARAFINGFSEFINEISVGIVIFTVHWLLLLNGDDAAIAGFSIANYVLFISMMAYYGIVDAIHILVSQNLGAGNHRRIRQFMILAAITILSISTVLVLVCTLIPHHLSQLFLSDLENASQQSALLYLNILWPCLMFSGLNVLISAYFTAVQKPLQSTAIALSRGLVLPVVLLLSFSTYLKQTHFLAALPVAEFITLALALTLFAVHQKRKTPDAPVYA